MFTDASFISTRSLTGNTCYQSYSSDNFVYIDPTRNQLDCPDSLVNFVHNVGAPAELISDHDSMLIGPKS